MTCREDRQTLMTAIAEACAAGARLAQACSLAGIDVRTFQRWRDGCWDVTLTLSAKSARRQETNDVCVVVE
jgi:hypothetical protein